MCANDNHPTWFPLPSTLFSVCNLKHFFESLVWLISLIKFVFSFVNIRVSYVSEYEVAFDKFATGGVLEYKDIKKFFESVGHVPSQKEIDDAIELVTKSKSRDHSLKC